eukprot:6176988-Pleurochrysis_carterae.AAC.9
MKDRRFECTLLFCLRLKNSIARPRQSALSSTLRVPAPVHALATSTHELINCVLLSAFQQGQKVTRAVLKNEFVGFCLAGYNSMKHIAIKKNITALSLQKLWPLARLYRLPNAKRLCADDFAKA